MNFLNGFEISFSIWMNGLYTNEIINKFFIFITNIGNSGKIWIAISLLLLVSKKYRKFGIASIIALITSLLFTNGILKNLVQRIRPFQYYKDLEILIDKPGEFSFPSGHTSASFASAIAIWLSGEDIAKSIKYGLILLAILMGFSRIYLCVHFVSDVILGAIFGIAYGFIGYKLMNRIYK